MENRPQTFLIWKQILKERLNQNNPKASFLIYFKVDHDTLRYVEKHSMYVTIIFLIYLICKIN